MSTENSHRTFQVRAWKYVNHPTGAALYCDADEQLWTDPRHAHGKGIVRITLEEVADDASLDGIGFQTRHGVVADVPRSAFRRLRRQLAGRAGEPVSVTGKFRVDGHGSLMELEIDGVVIGQSGAPISDVAPKPGGGTPGPGAAQTG